MARKKQPANVVGKEIQKRRHALGLTQEKFAARCQLHALDMSRGTISQIEAQIRGVRDFELFQLAAVLKVSADDLLPQALRKSRPKPRK